MKNRLPVIVIIIFVLLGLFLLPRFIKKSPGISQFPSEQTTGQASESAGANIDSYLKEAEAFEQHGSLLEAKEIYKRLMETQLSAKQMSAVQSRLENINVKILLSGINIEQSQLYEVKPGDVLINIAKEFNTTVESIAKANNIKENAIYPGMKLRILKGNFSIFVDKSQNVLILKLNDEVVKTYSVSTGVNNSTPVGIYKIVNKIVNPPWYKDNKLIPPTSPENILGSRWLGFNLPGYGIHGTTQPQDIGKQITNGCVRMKNEDVEELYSLVPTGTEATIVD